MLALSIRQPWASLIIHHGKDVENRDWPTRVRGRILVHAAKGCTIAELADGLETARAITRKRIMGELSSFDRGGLIGTVEIVDCVTESDSPWFVGKFGFVLRDPRPMKFVPWRGQLGFFEAPWPLPGRRGIPCPACNEGACDDH